LRRIGRYLDHLANEAAGRHHGHPFRHAAPAALVEDGRLDQVRRVEADEVGRDPAKLRIGAGKTKLGSELRVLALELRYQHRLLGEEVDFRAQTGVIALELADTLDRLSDLVEM